MSRSRFSFWSLVALWGSVYGCIWPSGTSMTMFTK